LERYKRWQQQVDWVLLEAFLLGHSTRKTVRIFKRLFGDSVSPQTVSNIVKELNEQVRGFHRRALGDDYRFLYLDGLWITLSKPVKVKKVLLVALGIRIDGSKELLGFQLANSESESWWWGFLSDLKSRGLKGENLEVMVSDGASGLIKAFNALFPQVDHQLCTFHKASGLGLHLANRAHYSHIISDALYISSRRRQPPR